MPTLRLTDRFARTQIRSALWIPVVAGILSLAAGRSVAAQTATQVVTFRVIAQSRAAVTPIAAPIAVRPLSASVANGAFTLSTNEGNQKIVASLDHAMPAGATLSAAIGAPAAGTSTGMQALATTATDVVTGIAVTADAKLPIAYRVMGAASNGQSAGAQRLVTYTVLAGA